MISFLQILRVLGLVKKRFPSLLPQTTHFSGALFPGARDLCPHCLPPTPSGRTERSIPSLDLPHACPPSGGFGNDFPQFFMLSYEVRVLVTQLCQTLWSKAYLFLRNYSVLSLCRKLFQTIWGFTILFAPWSSLFHNLYCKSHHFILCFQTGIILIYMWISEDLLLFKWLPVMSEIPPGATIPLV